MRKALVLALLASTLAYAGARRLLLGGSGGGMNPVPCPAAPQLSLSLVTSNDNLNRRDGAGMVAADDGTLVLLGGWNGNGLSEWSEDGGSNFTTNSVLKSTNNGASWTTVLAHKDDPPQTGAGQRWRRRHSACWMTATVEGQKFIYVIGGDGFDTYWGSDGNGSSPYPADVWRGPLATYGATWERMTGAAPWGSRTLQFCWFMNGALYVAGGQTSLLASSVLNDVWKSLDGGRTWIRQPDAPWSGRGSLASQTPVFLNQAWIVGGQQYDTTSESRVFFNDIWVFDGTGWGQIQPNPPLQARGYHNSFVMLGRLWVGLGTVAGGGFLDDLWSTSDGRCWSLNPHPAGYADHAVSVAPLPTGKDIIIAGGNINGAVVWKMSAP